uniref:Uncharacterized protein n=1 Tax=Dromaius novaehollandiae TaxID=8790 RepID=A0A8C4K7C7_DRONO
LHRSSGEYLTSLKLILCTGAAWICYICTFNHHALDQCLVIWKILDIGCRFTVAGWWPTSLLAQVKASCVRVHAHIHGC